MNLRVLIVSSEQKKKTQIRELETEESTTWPPLVIKEYRTFTHSDVSDRGHSDDKKRNKRTFLTPPTTFQVLSILARKPLGPDNKMHRHVQSRDYLCTMLEI